MSVSARSISKKKKLRWNLPFPTHLFLPVFDFVVMFHDRRLNLFDAEPDAQRLLLQVVLLLLQDLDLL